MITIGKMRGRRKGRRKDDTHLRDAQEESVNWENSLKLLYCPLVVIKPLHEYKGTS